MTANPKDDTKPTRSTVGRKALIGLVAIACVAGGGYLLLQRRAGAQHTEAPEQASESPAECSSRKANHQIIKRMYPISQERPQHAWRLK